jgi:hypothetical protein
MAVSQVDRGARRRRIAVSLGITGRRASGIVTGLDRGRVRRQAQKTGHHNRYQIQARHPIANPASQEPAIGEVLALPASDGARQQLTGACPPLPGRARR